MIKERPILFADAMVRALLDGSKTQTRRVVKPQPIADSRFVGEAPYVGLACPHGKTGDRLWVRETHYIIGEGNQYFYRATGGFSQHKEFDEANGNTPLVWAGPWKPSIFMPRAACRTLLEITSVRVERLQDISEADALAEGCKPNYLPNRAYEDQPYRSGFVSLWQGINGHGSWAANPWVWVIEFKRVKP